MSILSLPPGKTSRTSQTVLPYIKFSRCVGRFLGRDQLARDVACLLEFDDTVTCWSCQSLKLRHGCDICRAPAYLTMARGDIDPVRLKNCKDLLQSSGGEVSLGDRVRLLSALDEHSSLTLAECLSVFQETKPIRGLANMVVGRFVEIDLDTALIGPETPVRRYRG